MPGRPPLLTRADLPAELTAETLRDVPLGTLRRLARPGNGILDAEEQAAFDAALHEVMSQTAGRVSRQLGRHDWQQLRRDANRSSQGRRPDRIDQQLQRIADRLDRQADVAQSLAPGVDWSFAQSDDQDDSASPASEHDDGTVADLEDQITDQVELVQVMTEIAEVSKRTYALEQQRDLQNTRSVFFGFVVSVAVLVAGYAPIVAAEDWSERWWIMGLTLATIVVAAGVYMLVRRYQNAHAPAEESE